jgi:succinate dehydrogenase / fumarate reductase cytochrome b subunit
VPLIAWTFCFCLHLTNGIRHLFWDAGVGFERSTIQASGWTVVLVTLVATAAFSLLVIV